MSSPASFLNSSAERWRPLPTPADAGELARPLLRLGDERGEVGGRDGRPDAEEARHGSDEADGREVAQRLVAARGVQERHRRDRRGGDHHRAAVRGRLDAGQIADRAAPAGPVLDHETSPQGGCEPLGDEPRDHVRPAAGREGHDHRDGAAVRPGLAPHDRRCRETRGGGSDQEAACEGVRHGGLPIRSSREMQAERHRFQA